MVTRRQPWLAHNNQLTSVVAWPYRPRTTHNGQPTSDVAWLHTTVSRRRPWTARIGRGLRNIGRGLVDNMWMSMHSQNQKSGIMHNNIFIYFPSSILNVSASRGSFAPNFIIFTVYYFLRNVSKIKIY